MHPHAFIVTSLALVASAASFADPPKEPHFDCWIRVVRGQVLTGAISERGVPVSTCWRTFGAELGEDEQFPFSSTEPGFQLRARDGTPNQVLAFDVTGPVQRWIGDGFATFGENMLVQFGPASVETGPGPIAGFQFAANELGSLHDHFDFTLLGVDGVDPQPGVYALGLTLEGVDPPLATSKPFYFVFNLGQDEPTHDAAIEYADLFLACLVDVDGSGAVDGGDIGALIARWNEAGDGGGVGDLNHDGIVDAADLGILLGAWGHVCP
ncbi:MAG: hypothetical protein U0575_02340 [Phycisphaerales bacterium]